MGQPGGGKSYAVWSLAVLKCLEFNNIRVGLARQTLVQIKKNSMSTFYEVCAKLGITDKYYNYNDIKGSITFINGSSIQFYELRYMPSDPDYDRFGGALLTFGIIEEAAGCEAKGKEVFSSRLGRWMNDVYNIPPHLYLTTNPGTNFVYSDFYIPWTKGELEEHRVYIPAKLTDNTYRSRYYEDSLRKRLDTYNADRLLKGDWNFDGDNTRLCTYLKVRSVFEIPREYEKKGEMYLTADIAFTSDKLMILIWQGLTVTKVINLPKELDPEKEIERLALEYKIKQEHIVYDADGVGKYLKGKFPRAYDFINNSKPIDDEHYENAKAQAYYKLAELINKEEIKCEDRFLMEETVQELYEIKSAPLEETTGKLKIVPKKAIKKILGRSPDISDAYAFRMVFEIKKPIIRPFAIRR